MRAQREVVINRPIHEVFDFLADGTNNPRWQPWVEQTVQGEGPLGAGTSFRQSVRHPLGFRVPTDYRLTVFERPRTLALVGTAGGPFRPTQTYELTASGPDVTAVRCTIEYQPSGLARLMTPVLALAHPRFARAAAAVEQARDVLESSAAALLRGL
jgi:uncharacterized membrane protein